MEKKEVIDGKKPAAAAAAAAAGGHAASRPWEEGERVSSVSELFERLNEIPSNRPRAVMPRREISSSELLELLSKQQQQQRSSHTLDGIFIGGSSKNQFMYGDKKHDYETAAIDQCDITSSVDYGSRDYYYPSAQNSNHSNAGKENESDDRYKTWTDTRGNWWQGSFYY